jgi:hypothetical protein
VELGESEIGMSLPTDERCPLCGTLMAVASWDMYSFAGTVPTIGITCMRKYCPNNAIERQVYNRRLNDPFRSQKIKVYREFCGL